MARASIAAWSKVILQFSRRSTLSQWPLRYGRANTQGESTGLIEVWIAECASSLGEECVFGLSQ